MDIYVLNTALETLGVIDQYQSCIWTTRYYSTGDFELYLGATTEALDLLQKNRILVRDMDMTETEMHNLMVIQNIELKTDAENGNTITVTGSSLGAIIGQRVVIYQSILRGQVNACIARLLFENIVEPENTERQIPNFTIDSSPEITDTMEMQITGDNLAETISEICQTYELGWELYIKNNNFAFRLYKGIDRSYNQTENPFVVFSTNFDNLISSDYTDNITDYKNVAIVAGEGEGNARKLQVVGTASGLNRYEVWVDARDVSSNDGEIQLTDYTTLLQEQGQEALAGLDGVQAFEGETDTTVNYILNQDFFLGDIVQIENDYGIGATARILEIIDTDDDTGRTVIPTFSTMEL